MMLSAARALADFTTPEQIKQGQIYPEAKDLRACAATVCLLLLVLVVGSVCNRQFEASAS